VLFFFTQILKGIQLGRLLLQILVFEGTHEIEEIQELSMIECLSAFLYAVVVVGLYAWMKASLHIQQKSAKKYVTILIKVDLEGWPPSSSIMKVTQRSRTKSDSFADMTFTIVSLFRLPPLLRVMYLVVISRVIVNAMLSSELNMLFRLAMWKKMADV
jgi:hypothetical protein